MRSAIAFAQKHDATIMITSQQTTGFEGVEHLSRIDVPLPDEGIKMEIAQQAGGNILDTEIALLLRT
ncbi:hypothetical protein NL529_33160, partial [Klebsiella pneumoniae]|nr:hypothetical protein [Klebsiella pneumoniae]